MPPPLKAVRMAAWVSWHAALCLLMMWLLWCEHWPAMCVHESGKPHSGHASVGANPYLYASLPLYSWPYRNLRMVMPSLGELRMREWRAVPTITVRAPRALALRMRRLYSEVWWRLLRVAVRTFCLSCLEG